MLSWHTKHFASLVKTLRDTPEGAGKLIDNCAIVMMTEGGSGWDPEGVRNNNPHSTENVSMIVAGPGKADSDARPVQVFNTMLKAIGVPDADAFVSDQKKGFVPGLLA